MTTPWLISNILLWGIVLTVGFLLLGALRSLGLLQWRLDELEATRPVRKGREGLPPGKPAPDFTLPAADGGEVSLSDFAGRKVLLVFTQSGCGPCHAVLPDLNQIQSKGEYQVLVVNNGVPQDAADTADEFAVRFPILTQDVWDVSKRYQVFATPYAFVVDEQGVISARGVVSASQYLRYLFDAAARHSSLNHDTIERDSIVDRGSPSVSTSKEVLHA